MVGAFIVITASAAHGISATSHSGTVAFVPMTAPCGSYLRQASCIAFKPSTFSGIFSGEVQLCEPRMRKHGLTQWTMAHSLSKEQKQRNEELNEQRKKQNLAIAARVAAGELRPVVVSFSPTMRVELRLAKRFKHTRIFVETHEVRSLSALHKALVREIPYPLGELPAETFELALRPPSADEDAQEASGDSTQDDSKEDWYAGAAPLHSDAQLHEAYSASQQARSSGVGKLRLCVVDTPTFRSFLDTRRGYKLEQDGSLPGGLSPADATHWIMTSFYTLRPVPEVAELTVRLVAAWQPLGVLGRVYVASEGVNAQGDTC